jgi:hypothetical protein
MDFVNLKLVWVGVPIVLWTMGYVGSTAYAYIKPTPVFCQANGTDCGPSNWFQWDNNTSSPFLYYGDF